MKKTNMMVILIGLPGSGKSTFYQRQFANTHLRINLDMLKTRAHEKALLDVCLATQTCVVVDNTNVQVSERASYMTMANWQTRGTALYFEQYQKTGVSRLTGAQVNTARRQIIEHNELPMGDAFRAQIHDLLAQVTD